jgi:hypothetical protein
MPETADGVQNRVDVSQLCSFCTLETTSNILPVRLQPLPISRPDGAAGMVPVNFPAAQVSPAMGNLFDGF